jgi:hypothetical protein
MIKDKIRPNRLTGRCSTPTVVVLAAVGLGSAIACGTGDEPGTRTESLQPITPIKVNPLVHPAPAAGGQSPAPALPGGAVPAGVQDWKVLGVIHTTDDKAPKMRVIVGNDIAVAAARAGQPWPDGSMLSHLSWKPAQNPDDAATTGPGDFSELTLMVKDSTKYAADGNWAYSVWSGPNLTPPADPTFDRACVGCHTSSGLEDSVFTAPGQLPSEAVIAAAAAAPNGQKFPAGILDWRVLGIADIAASATSPETIRVIVGNDTAVDAARAGNTDPWPNGSIISHYVWNVGSNDKITNAVVPGDFGAFTYMTRDDAKYAADGDWAFAVWATPQLTPPADPAFDRACVNCHTSREATRDLVFSRPGALPPSMIAASVVR